MSLARIRFYIVQQLRSYRWFATPFLFAAVLFSALRWADDMHYLFGQGLTLAVVAAFSIGVAGDRRTGFDLYAQNFTTPWVRLLEKAIAAAMLLAVLFVFAFALAALTWREPRLALWYTMRAVLFISLMLPLALLLELLLDTEFPAVIAAFVFTLGIAIGVMYGEQRFVDFIGLDVPNGSFSGLRRLLTVNLTWNLLVLLAPLAVWGFRYRSRLARPPG